MTTLADFYDRILPFAAGLDTGTADMQLRRIIRQFLRKTTLVRTTISFTLTVGTPTYTINASQSYQDVGGVLKLTMNGSMRSGADYVPLDALTEPTTPGPSTIVNNAQPRGFTFTPPSTLTFYPTPDQAYPCSVLIYESLVTSSANSTVPDAVMDYADCIADGVLAQLLAMPQKPWTDLRTSQVHQIEYANRTLSIRNRFREGGASGPLRLRPAVPFGV